ncbi:MAG: hypothetical protein ACLSHC_10440 [Bilophila wadsworthia]
MEIETQCLYAGYSPKNGEPQTLPICQSTTFKYESTEQVSELFDLEEPGSSIPVSAIPPWTPSSRRSPRWKAG